MLKSKVCLGTPSPDSRTIVKGMLLGLVLVAACGLIHVTSMVVIGEWLIKKRVGIEKKGLIVWPLPTLLSAIFGVVIFLHLAEITLWAIVYHSLGLLNGFGTSLSFSLGSYTTEGTPRIELPEEWKLLGQLESIAGALLIGLSTAFLFFVIHKAFEIRQIAHGKEH